MDTRLRPSATPRNVAAIYAVASGLWILFSDRAVAAAVDDPAVVTQLQTVKGWLFVAGSAVLIYALVRHGQRDLARTNERLDTALQQSSILHRVLRHNLRNSCNVIAGNADLLAEHADDASAETRACLDAIRDQSDHLERITQKTRQLRDLVFEDRPFESVDLAALLSEHVEEARERFPHADFETDLPETYLAKTDPRLGLAVEELLENAVEHNDAASPSVRVSLRPDAAGAATIEVADDGPGMPEVERTLLERGTESPMVHSEGLGLWIARTVAVEAGGEVRLARDDPQGTVVRLVLPG